LLVAAKKKDASVVGGELRLVPKSASAVRIVASHLIAYCTLLRRYWFGDLVNADDVTKIFIFVLSRPMAGLGSCEKEVPSTFCTVATTRGQQILSCLEGLFRAMQKFNRCKVKQSINLY